MSNVTDATLEPKIKRSVEKAATTGDTVVVACKLPNGLVLQNDMYEEMNEPVMGGGYTKVRRSRRLPETYTVNGSAVDLSRLEQGDIPHVIASGFGLTYGIPKEFWEIWLEQHESMEIVKQGLIFAVPTEMDARKEAGKRTKIKSGLEPIDPQNPGARTGIRRIMTGTRNPD